MPQYVFGTGNLYTTPVGGGQPFQFGALQDVSVDFSGDIKMLHGQYQFPLSSARGKSKIEGKAATGEVDVSAFNTFYFGQEVTEDSNLAQIVNEPGAVPAMSTYTVTVAHGADFSTDLGVKLADGTPLKQVAAMPATGEYSVNSSTGVYTFNSAQASANVLISYLYDEAVGGTLEGGNPLMGVTPRFQMILSQTFEDKAFTLILYSCIAGKLSLPLKQDDYLIADLDFSAMADNANRVFRMTTSVA